VAIARLPHVFIFFSHEFYVALLLKGGTMQCCLSVCLFRLNSGSQFKFDMQVSHNCSCRSAILRSRG